jgi:hypothetical protein
MYPWRLIAMLEQADIFLSGFVLPTAAYYDEGQRVTGEWFGLGAKHLGLSGKVHANDFLRLCENQHLATGARVD